MKKLEDVKHEIALNKGYLMREGSKITDREYNKISRENELLETIARYLETKPSEESLKNTKERFERIIKNKSAQYGYWLGHVKPPEIEDKNAKTFFNKENGLTHLRRQIKTLNLILE